MLSKHWEIYFYPIRFKETQPTTSSEMHIKLTPRFNFATNRPRDSSEVTVTTSRGLGT